MLLFNQQGCSWFWRCLCYIPRLTIPSARRSPCHSRGASPLLQGGWKIIKIIIPVLRFLCTGKAGRAVPGWAGDATDLLISPGLWNLPLFSILRVGLDCRRTKRPKGPSNLHYSLIPCNELESFQNLNGKDVGRLLLESQTPNENYAQVLGGHPPLQVLPGCQSSGTCCCLLRLLRCAAGVNYRRTMSELFCLSPGF